MQGHEGRPEGVQLCPVRRAHTLRLEPPLTEGIATPSPWECWNMCNYIFENNTKLAEHLESDSHRIQTLMARGAGVPVLQLVSDDFTQL